MLLTYVTIGSIASHVKNTYSNATKEEQLKHVENKIIEKGYTHKDYRECMSLILEILNENKNENKTKGLKSPSSKIVTLSTIKKSEELGDNR